MDVSVPGRVEAEEYFSWQKYLLSGLFSSCHSGVQFPAFCSFSLMAGNMDSP